MTDEDLAAIYKRANGEDVGKAQPITTARVFKAMRAALGLGAPQQAAPTAEWNTERGQRCPHCDGTGDVHSIDGQWRGRCYCPEGQASPNSAPTAVEPVAWMTEDGRVASHSTKTDSMHKVVADSYCIPLVRGTMQPTPEQGLRDALEAMGSARAQSLSAGDLLAVVCDVDSPLQAEPVAWVRFCGDGLYEGPVMNCDKARMEDVRHKLSEWTPLAATTQPEQLARDQSAWGMSITKGGKRIDPRDFLKPAVVPFEFKKPDDSEGGLP